MTRSPPKEVYQLEKTKDPQRATTILGSLAKRKRLWYTAVMLALSGAGYAVVRKYMDLKGLKGLGPVKVDILEHQGTTLGIEKASFNTHRLRSIESQATRLLNNVRSGKTTKEAALFDYIRLFQSDDPDDLKKALWTSFAVEVDAIGSWLPIPRREFWNHQKKLTNALQKYSLH